MGERILPEGYQGEGKGAPEFEVKGNLVINGNNFETNRDTNPVVTLRVKSGPLFIDRLTGLPYSAQKK